MTQVIKNFIQKRKFSSEVTPRQGDQIVFFGQTFENYRRSTFLSTRQIMRINFDENGLGYT
jgi:hypothetical protein